MVVNTSPSIITVLTRDGVAVYQNAQSVVYCGDRCAAEGRTENLLAAIFEIEPQKLVLMVGELDQPDGSGLWKGIVRVPPSLRRQAQPPPLQDVTPPRRTADQCGLPHPPAGSGSRSSADGGGGGYFVGSVGASAILLNPESCSDHDLDRGLDPERGFRQFSTGPSGLAAVVGGCTLKRGSASGAVGIGTEWSIGPEAEADIPLPSSLLGPEDDAELLPMSQLECGDLKVGGSTVDPRVTSQLPCPRWPAAAAVADAAADTAAAVAAATTTTTSTTAATATGIATATAAITEGHSSLILANSTSYGSHRWYDTTGTYGSRPSAQRPGTANGYLAAYGSYFTGTGGGGGASRRMLSGTYSASVSTAATAPAARQLLRALAASPCGQRPGGPSRPGSLILPTNTSENVAVAAGGMDDPLATSTFATLRITPPPTPAVHGPAAAALLPSPMRAPVVPSERNQHHHRHHHHTTHTRRRSLAMCEGVSSTSNATDCPYLYGSSPSGAPGRVSSYLAHRSSLDSSGAVTAGTAAAAGAAAAAATGTAVPAMAAPRGAPPPPPLAMPRSLAFALSLGTSPVAAVGSSTASLGSSRRRRATIMGTVTAGSTSKPCFTWSQNDQGLAGAGSSGGDASALPSPAVSMAAAAPPPGPPSAPAPFACQGAAVGVPYTTGGSRLARLLRSPLETSSSPPPTPPSGTGGGTAGGGGGAASGATPSSGADDAGLRRRSSAGTAPASPASAATAVLKLVRGLGRLSSVPGARVSPLPRDFTSLQLAAGDGAGTAVSAVDSAATGRVVVQGTAAAASNAGAATAASDLGPFAASTAANIAACITGPTSAPAVAAVSAGLHSGRGVMRIYDSPRSPFLTPRSVPSPPPQPPQPMQPHAELQAPQGQQPQEQKLQRLNGETGEELLLRPTPRGDLEVVAEPEAVVAVQGEDEGQEPAECWHEVWATASTDPITGDKVVVLIQTDVTAKVIAERHLALVMETEHRLVEQLFPRHILQYITEEWTSTAAGAEGGGANCGAAARGGGGAELTSWRPVVRDCNALATSHPEVTLLFADIKGFTPMCKEVEPQQVMALLNSLYSRYDAMLDEYGVYKVETIGDCYFVAGGLIHQDEDGMAAVRGCSNTEDPLHAERVFGFAKAMLSAASEVLMPTSGAPVEIRIGLHTGPVVSGVVGTRMPRFCLFGDTVNTASRMESTGLPGAIHASEATFQKLAAVSRVGWEPTGGIEVKGKGLMQTYFWRPSSTAVGPDTPTGFDPIPAPAAALTPLPAPLDADSSTAVAAGGAANSDTSTLALSLELPKQQQQAALEHAPAPTIGRRPAGGGTAAGPPASAATWRSGGAADCGKDCQRAEPSFSGFDLPRPRQTPLPPLRT